MYATVLFTHAAAFALYTCSSFPNWSAAQACFNQCRLTVGYDIHGLDEDGDGVACEMAMEGASPFTLPVLPTPVATPVDAGSTADGAAASPTIQDTATATLPILPASPMPTATAAVAATVVATVTATVAELPTSPAEAAAGAAETPALRSPTMALPWVIVTAAVAAAAGALIWLRRRG
ncbi:MAG: hypothetical protein DCC57_19005 [Chloroflexi bacterium]|nr:MAG: hypothetical protein DCC57_19005 [Chloroflexota bacterium]